MALSSISAVTVFASEVQPKNQRNEMSREEAVEWSLREYNVSRVVTDTPDPSEGVYNENDLIATGTFANGLARATSWKAYHGNNSKGVPYGRLTNTTKVNMCIYGLIDYSCGETIMHDEPVVYSSNHTHTIDLIEGGAGDWGSGYSTFLYVIDDVQVHKSTSPMWFNIH
mgnify:FL=1